MCGRELQSNKEKSRSFARLRYAQHKSTPPNNRGRIYSYTHPSRSPDLRLRQDPHSLLGAYPMTDFRQRRISKRIQWRYRSGFTPDSLFSPQARRRCGALKCLFSFRRKDIAARCFCQYRSTIYFLIFLYVSPRIGKQTV